MAKISPTTIKQGDVRQTLQVTLPLDEIAGATAADARLLARDVALVLPLTFAGTTTGVLEHEWAEGETSVAGRYEVEIEATWPDGTSRIWPPSGYLTLRIAEDLDLEGVPSIVLPDQPSWPVRVTGTPDDGDSPVWDDATKVWRPAAGGSGGTDEVAREAAAEAQATAEARYVKPGGGIPAADLAPDVATQAELDSGLGLLVPKAGGTMTGPLTLSGDPVDALHAATRQYVLAQIAALVNGAPDALDTLKEIADQLASDESAVSALVAAVAAKYSKPGGGIPATDLAFDPATQAELDALAGLVASKTGPATTTNAGITTLGASGGAATYQRAEDLAAQIALLQPDGNIEYGTGAPGAGVGQNGDSYVDTAASPPRLYGPKANGTWPGTYVTLGGGGGGSTEPRFNIVTYGADKTGANDSYPAIIAARDAASAAGGGVVYAPTGLYKTLSPITSWPNGVSLVGDGPGQTIFKPTFADESFLKNIKSAGAPMIGCTFAAFQIDGTAQTQSAGYISGTKGLFSQYHRRCHWRDLYIHDTPATGLGVDHFQDCTIDRVHVEGCGRLNDGTQAGGNGIGLGSGGFPIENVVVSNSTAKNNARFNIFFERQVAVANTPLFSRIHHCHTEGGKIGIGDCGNGRTIIDHNTISGATLGGIVLNGGTVSTFPGSKTRIVDNEIDACPVGILYDTTGSGTANGPLGTELGRITVARNRITAATQYGIQGILKTYDVYGLRIIDNEIELGQKSAIYFSYNSGTKAIIDSEIKRNRLRNNGLVGTGTDRDGIKITVACTNVEIDDNRAWDDQATPTQRYGVVISGGSFTGGSIARNDGRSNASGGNLFSVAPSATTRLSGNLGFSAVAPVAEVPAASPWTRAASVVPETLHLSGGTVTNVTIGGVSVAASTDVAIPLEPGDAPVLTYSAAPTVSARKR